MRIAGIIIAAVFGFILYMFIKNESAKQAATLAAAQQLGAQTAGGLGTPQVLQQEATEGVTDVSIGGGFAT